MFEGAFVYDFAAMAYTCKHWNAMQVCIILGAFLCCTGEEHNRTLLAMARKLVLHVGPYKTGSTTIQEGIHGLSNVLMEDGWSAETRPLTRIGSRDIDPQNPWNQSPIAPCIPRREYIARIKTAAEKSAKGCLESNEEWSHSSNRDIAFIAGAFVSLRVTVVIVDRVFYDLIASTWRELRLTKMRIRYYAWVSSGSAYARFKTLFNKIVFLLWIGS